MTMTLIEIIVLITILLVINMVTKATEYEISETSKVITDDDKLDAMNILYHFRNNEWHSTRISKNTEGKENKTYSVHVKDLNK